MIKTTEMLREELGAYSNPKAKLSRMVKKGECFPIVKGLYETNKNVPGYLLARSIYGPSYISFEYALGHYGMIPEAVYIVTSATFEKKKKKTYENAFGAFTYRDVPSAVFPLALRLVREGEYFDRIAEPEKALCDLLYTLPPVKNTRELAALAFDDLRIEEGDMRKMDLEKIMFLSRHYRSSNTRKLVTLLRRLKK